jgi:hypothetical protein
MPKNSLLQVLGDIYRYSEFYLFEFLFSGTVKTSNYGLSRVSCDLYGMADEW